MPAVALDTGEAEGTAGLVQRREQPGPLAGPGKQKPRRTLDHDNKDLV